MRAASCSSPPGGGPGSWPSFCLNSPRRGRRVRRAVVVELHVHDVGLLGQAARPAGDLLELLARVLPAESLGDAAAGEVALGVPPVRAQVGELRVRHGVHRRHDRQMVAGRRVDAHERRAVLRQEVERVLQPLARPPSRGGAARPRSCAARAPRAAGAARRACGPSARTPASAGAGMRRTCPASSSGATAASVASTIACSVSGRSTTRPRLVVRALSRRSGGSDSSGAEWRERKRWSL